MSDTNRSRPPAVYQERADSLLTMLRQDFGVPRAERTVLAVAGESGSGKSVTATDLAAVMTAAGIAAALIHQDDYFVRPPRTNHEHRVSDITSVGPQEVRMDLIEAHMQAFRRGAAVEAPMVNYPENRFDTRTLHFAAVQLLIVEGTYALRLHGWDIGIFLHATWRDTETRRKARNRDIDDPFVDRVLDIEHHLIAPQAELAHILLDRDFDIRRRL